MMGINPMMGGMGNMNGIGGMDPNMINLNMMNGGMNPNMAGMDPLMMANMGMPGMANMGMPGMGNMGMTGMGNMGMPGMDNMGMAGMGNMGMAGMGNIGMPGMGNMGMAGMGNMGMAGMGNIGMGNLGFGNMNNIAIDDAQGWNLIFENQNDRQAYIIRISEQKTIKEAISLYRLKSMRTDKCKFILNSKELYPEMRICESGLQDHSRILVISLQNLKGAF